VSPFIVGDESGVPGKDDEKKRSLLVRLKYLKDDSIGTYPYCIEAGAR
jgi:hypothetical protein